TFRAQREIPCRREDQVPRSARNDRGTGEGHRECRSPRRTRPRHTGLPIASATMPDPASGLMPVARLDQTPFELDIVDLSHDGRGVARRPDGKAVFVADALPGERVVVRQTARSRSFDEATTLEVLQASPDRVTPRCPHFGVCSGCVLQHLDESKQILAKQRVLLENFERIGHVAPAAVLPPLTGGAWGYR